MQALLALPKPPTAVFVANNLMTLGALRALARGGQTDTARHRPGRLRRHAVGDLTQSTAHRRGSTRPRVGSHRRRIVAGSHRGPERSVRHVVLETTLIVRASCGAARRSKVVVRLTPYGLRLTAYGLRLTAYGLRLTAYGLRAGAGSGRPGLHIVIHGPPRVAPHSGLQSPVLMEAGFFKTGVGLGRCLRRKP